MEQETDVVAPCNIRKPSDVLFWLSLTLVFLMIASWVVSLFGILWAPHTRRHKLMLISGEFVFQWQLPSMPCTLPPNASKADIPVLTTWGPGDRHYHDMYAANGKPNARCSAVWFEPGYKVLGFQGVRVPRWLPRYRFSTSCDTYYFSLPLYIPLIVFAILPLWRLFQSWFRPPPPGHCRRCGYDLTGNQSGICPECGQSAGIPAAPVRNALHA